MSATTSPQKDKVNWVKFENETEAVEAEFAANSRSSSSGVSSARGSVNSVQLSPHEEAKDEADRGVLPVTETQVVDEQSLRGQKSLSGGHEASATPQVFKQMSSSPSKMAKSSEMMDNVNLDESPSKDQIRGRRFTNGEVIVTLLPVNERLPWITPAKFRPELVPEELMAPILTLTVEDYVQTMEKLTTDMRFTIYNICYKRILIVWIAAAFLILLALLFSGQRVSCILLLKLFKLGVAEFKVA